MTPQLPHTPAWKAFTYVSFVVAAGMLALGVFSLNTDLWVKGYFAMAGLMTVASSFTLAKTLRDEQEASRLINRIEDAKAEHLLKSNLEEPLKPVRRTV